MLDISGANWTYNGFNAWTEFGGDYVTDLKEIRASWHLSSTAGNLNMKALIKDANGNWFVSNDVTSDAKCCNPVIDATATTWRILNSDPVIGTVLNVGSAATPDLSKVYGGGLLTVGLAAGAQTRLDALIFTNQISGTPPAPTISLDKSSYYSTEDITITWSDAPGNTEDRVALYLPDWAPPGSCSTQIYLPLSWADVSGTSGQTTIDNVLVPGDYVAVYMVDNKCAAGNFINFSVAAGPATGRDIEPKMLMSYSEGGLADPQIYEEGGTYYITGTSSGAWGPIYSTDDFVTINTQWMEIDTTPWPYGYQHIWAFEIYKHTDGTYHGYGYDYDRGGLYHFEPDPDPATTTFPVLRWKEKEFLTWDYDSKVIHDGTDLWLFSAYQSEGSGHIPTYVHRMSDPGTIDTSYTPHRVMSENGNWLTSELRNRGGAMKIHEGASPLQVTAGGTTKWVMPYTVGDYANRRYKIAFGYSDVLVPPASGEYAKATKADTQNVWASGVNAQEVVYVTQTEKPSWPNYHAAIYGNPGSGDIFEYNGSYYMLFHATMPLMTDDMRGGSSYFGRSLWVVPLDFDFTGSMDTWAAVDLPDGEAAPVLTPSKAIFGTGEDIVINFENAGQGAWDQIRLHNDGAADGSFLDWNYVQGLSKTFLAPWGGDVWTWENTIYGFSGSMTFPGISTPGDYDARFFFVGNTLAASCDFTLVNLPPSWNSDPVIKPSATRGVNYNETLAGEASDTYTPGMTFSLISGPSWLAVASDGQMSGMPAVGDVGPNAFTVRVTDSGGLYDEATLNIEVIDAGNVPPAWNNDNMFKASAIEGLNYDGTLAADASDPDAGDTLTFSLVSGPVWLIVASNGQLSGIAADADTGSNAFTVRVTDAGGLYDEATLNVYVLGRYTGELGMSDLVVFASRWLDTDCGACGGADLDNDGDVNMQDWAVFAGHWLK
jgi:hypothetical protein